MAIALEAVSGALTGLSQTGPAAIGKAGAAGVEQGQKIAEMRKQQQAQQEQQAQTDAQSQSAATARKASLFEVNSRTLLNTSEAEAQGADAIDKLVQINRASGILDVDPELLESTTPMTQTELLAAMQAGKLNVTDHLGPVAGRILVTDKDGSTRWEATHLIVKDPNAKVALTQADWDRYSAAKVPGFPPGVNVGDSTAMVPLSMKARANEVAASHELANRRLADLRGVLEGSPLAQKVPTAVAFEQPGVESALQAYQRYISHDAANLADPYMALQAMGADRRDPKTGELQPNPDAKYVDTVASAFGGWPVLEAAHDQLAANSKTAEQFAVIDSQDKAEAVLSAPKRFTAAQQSAAQNFLRMTQTIGAQKATQEARAHASATGADVEAMYKFGKNPVTGERLSLDNAPDGMLVDGNGNVIPQNLLSVYKPTMQQRQTADTARQVLAITKDLRQAVAANPALAGPLSGRSKQALAKAGLGDAQAQKYLDDLSFLTSAATKMHTGRFSNEILKKMDNLIGPGMNPEQFGGALDSVTAVASRYSAEDSLTTVSDLRAQHSQDAQSAAGSSSQPSRNATGRAAAPNGGNAPQRVVPAGATPGRDAKGNVIGYRTASGQIVRF